MNDYNGEPIKVKRSPEGDTFAVLPLALAVELQDVLTRQGIKSALDDPTIDRRNERADTTLGFGTLSAEQALALQEQIDEVEAH